MVGERRGVAQDVRHRPVDQGVALAASLVGRAAAIADAGYDQAMLDAIDPMLVAGEPCDRADRARREYEAVAVAGLQRRQTLGQSVSSARPEQLSLASEGWQMWAERRTSSSVSPRCRYSP